jgi:hypothetical protein
VTDPSGAIVARAEVEAKSLQTLVIFSTITNENGLFAFPVLSLGVYELTAQHPGFAPLVVQRVTINVGAKVNALSDCPFPAIPSRSWFAAIPCWRQHAPA